MKLKNTIMTIAALCCGILPATAEDFTYDYTDGTLYYSIIKDAENCVEVTNYANLPKHLVIPPFVNIDGVEHKVVSMASYALECGDIEYLDLPYTMQRLGGCINLFSSTLKHISFPDNLEFIGQGAFQGCNQLKSVIIPDKVKGFVGSSFEGCTAVHTLVLGRGITSMGHNVIGGINWDYKEGIVDWSVLKEVYSLNPVPPEFGEHCITFTYIKDPADMILYVPAESIDKYTEFKYMTKI